MMQFEFFSRTTTAQRKSPADNCSFLKRKTIEYAIDADDNNTEKRAVDVIKVIGCEFRVTRAH